MRFDTSYVLTAVVLTASATVWGGSSSPGTPLQRFSYSLGASIGQQLAEDSQPVDIAAFTEGLQAGQSGQPLAMTAAEVATEMAQFEQTRARVQQVRWQQITDHNQQKEAIFLDKNKQKPGIRVLPSGLQYEIIQSGPAQGPHPSLQDTVQTHYRGTLTDGTVFDSSYERGEPATLSLQSVIPGWTEALQRMRPGDHWILYVPSRLAYGARGIPPKIEPYTTLIFDIELLSIISP